MGISLRIPYETIRTSMTTASNGFVDCSAQTPQVVCLSTSTVGPAMCRSAVITIFRHKARLLLLCSMFRMSRITDATTDSSLADFYWTCACVHWCVTRVQYRQCCAPQTIFSAHSSRINTAHQVHTHTAHGAANELRLVCRCSRVVVSKLLRLVGWWLMVNEPNAVLFVLCVRTLSETRARSCLCWQIFTWIRVRCLHIHVKPRKL